MKKITVLFVIAAALVLAIFPGCSSGNGAQLTDLQNQVSKLQYDLGSAQTEAKSYKDQLETKNDQINDLNASVTAKDSEISKLQNDLGAANTNLGAKDKQLTDLETQNTDLQKTLDEEKIFADLAKAALPAYYLDPAVASYKLLFRAIAKGPITDIRTLNGNQYVTMQVTGGVKIEFMTYASASLLTVVSGNTASVTALPADYFSVGKEIIVMLNYTPGQTLMGSLYYTDIPNLY